MAIYKRLVNSGVEGLADTLLEAFPDATVHYTAADVLIFTIPKFSNRVFKVCCTDGTYSQNISFYIGTEYTSGANIANSVCVGAKYDNWGNWNDNSIVCGFFNENGIGFFARRSDNVRTVCGIAKASNGKFYAYHFASEITFSNLSQIVDLENMTVMRSVPFGVSHRGSGGYNDALKFELHKIVLLKENFDRFTDDTGADIYFTNLFATISDMDTYQIYEEGFLTDTMNSQGEIYFRPRCLFLTSEPI